MTNPSFDIILNKENNAEFTHDDIEIINFIFKMTKEETILKNKINIEEFDSTNHTKKYKFTYDLSNTDADEAMSILFFSNYYDHMLKPMYDKMYTKYKIGTSIDQSNMSIKDGSFCLLIQPPTEAMTIEICKKYDEKFSGHIDFFIFAPIAEYKKHGILNLSTKTTNIYNIIFGTSSLAAINLIIGDIIIKNKEIKYDFRYINKSFMEFHNSIFKIQYPEDDEISMDF